MARFYRIHLDSIYLSSNGLSDGTPCKLQISGVEDLITPIAGIVEQSASGVPHFQTFAWTAGKQFEISVEVIPENIWNSLKTLLNNSLETNTPFTVSGTGNTGDFTVLAMPFPQKPFAASEFTGGRIKGAILRLITVLPDE